MCTPPAADIRRCDVQCEKILASMGCPLPEVHRGIGRSPYQMFGCPPRVGLPSTSLPSTVAAVLHTEKELQKTLSMPTTSSTRYCEQCLAVVRDGEECSCEEQTPLAVQQRHAAYRKQQKQVERMLKRSRSSKEEVTVGDNVRVGIPDVDRSRIENRNLICVVLQVSVYHS